MHNSNMSKPDQSGSLLHAPSNSLLHKEKEQSGSSGSTDSDPLLEDASHCIKTSYGKNKKVDHEFLKRDTQAKKGLGLLASYQKYLSVKSIEDTYRHLLYAKVLLEFAEGRDVPFAGMDNAFAHSYKAFLVTERTDLARGTVNNMLYKARVFCEFLFKRGMLGSNPFKHVPCLRGGHTIPKNILPVDQMGILLEGFSHRTESDIMLHTLIELLYGSALRIGEAESLKLDDIDFTAHVLTLTDSKAGGVRRTRPVTEVSLRRINYYLKTARDLVVPEEERREDFLFPQGCATRMRGLLNRRLKSECQRLGLPVISSHGFRHSCATHLLQSGAGIRQVQAFLGHEKITSTERYTRVVKEDLKRIVFGCHPRERNVSHEKRTA